MISAAECAAELNRMRRGRRLSPTFYSGAVLQLRADLMHAPDITKVAASNVAVEAAFTLLDAHPLGAIGGIVLRLALDLATVRRAAADDLVLVSTNRTLLRAARREGLQTFNPAAPTDTELATLIEP
jgi:hypothetical protein